VTEEVKLLFGEGGAREWWRKNIKQQRGGRKKNKRMAGGVNGRLGIAAGETRKSLRCPGGKNKAHKTKEESHGWGEKREKAD